VPELPSGNGEDSNNGESCDMGRVVGRTERVIVTENGIAAKGGKSCKLSVLSEAKRVISNQISAIRKQGSRG